MPLLWGAEKGLNNASQRLQQTQSFLLLADQTHRLAQEAVSIQRTRLSGNKEENILRRNKRKVFLLHFKCQNHVSTHSNRTGRSCWKQRYMIRRRKKGWIDWTGPQGSGFSGVWDTKVIVRKRKNNTLVSEQTSINKVGELVQILWTFSQVFQESLRVPHRKVESIWLTLSRFNYVQWAFQHTNFKWKGALAILPAVDILKEALLTETKYQKHLHTTRIRWIFRRYILDVSALDTSLLACQLW